MANIKCVIIDDEKRARMMLKNMIKELDSSIEIIGEAENVQKGIQLAEKNDFDIMFLDIKMPDGTGFNLLEGLKKRDFKVVFTTAFDQFAIKAIKYSALDYLLKPIDSDELKLSLKKISSTTENQGVNDNIDILIDNTNKKSGPDKIVLSTHKGMHIVNVNEIIRCEADDYYTKFYIKNQQRTIMVSKTLKYYNNILEENEFIRVHKSHLVNINFIKTYVKSDGGYILLTNEDKIPVSRRKKELVLRALESL